jgi:hypothetical protein
MLHPAGAPLRDELLERCARGREAPLEAALADADFDALALRVFAFQFEANPPYAAYCRRRGATPATVTCAAAVPAVPTAAFQLLDLVCGEPATAEAVFRTSGTTRGPERRGRHFIPDLSLYEASLLPAFAAFVLPAGAAPTLLALVPPAAELPDSSLAYMIDHVVRSCGGPASRHLAGTGAGAAPGSDDDAAIDVAAFHAAAGAAEAGGDPVVLLGTALAFFHLLERLARDGRRYRLPDGSRIMDTGGFKGHRRAVSEAELRAAYEAVLGISQERVVNEYGMTELCSQLYDAGPRDGWREDDPARPRRKAGPPWIRTSVVDPETLAPLPPGQTGILRHHDLANLGSVAAVQTEDLGYAVPGGIVLLGRAPGAAPRGCSIAMDLLLGSDGAP